MKQDKIRILYIDDYPLDRALVRDTLRESDLEFQITEATNQEEFYQQLSEDFDLVLSDFNILGFTGLAVLEAVHDQNPDLPVILLTGTGSEEIAAESIKRGAADYVIKTPQQIRRLPLTILSTLEKAQLEKEQRLAHQALIESEARYTQLVNTLQEGIWTLDNQGTTTFVNPAMAEMLGYKAQEMVGRHVFDFMDQPARKLAQQMLDRRQQGISEQHKFTFLHKNGSPIFTSLDSSPILGDKGEYLGAVAGVRDISKQVEAEKALQESRLQLQNLVENAPGSIWTLDRNYRLVSANPKFLKDLENAFHQPIQKGYALLSNISREESREWKGYYNRALAGERFQLERTRQRGEPGRWFEYFFTPIEGEEGHITGVMVQALDITDRKQSERKLDDNQRKYQSLINQIGAALFLHDQDGHLVEVNQRSVEQYGYTREELLTLQAQDIDPDYQERAQEGQFWDQLSQNSPQIFTARHQRKDGTIFPVEVTLTPLISEGQKYILALATDITDRILARRKLVESESKYRTLIEESPAVIIETDAVGNCILINGKFREVSGLSPEEARGIGWIKSIHPDDRENIQASWSFYVKGGKNWKEEFRFQDLEGQITWVQGEAVQLHNEDGSPRGYLITNTIIDTRKELEDQLRSSKLTLDILMGNLPGMAFSCRNKPDWEMLFVSQGAQDLTGYTPVELTDGKTIAFSDLIHPDDQQRVWDSIQDAFSENLPYQIQYRIIHRDGEERWVQEQGVATKRDREGNVVELDGFIQDITDQIKASRELKSTTETLTTVLDSIDAHIYVSALESYQILYMNDKMVKDFGEDYTGQQCYQVYRGQSSPCQDCRLPELIKGDITKDQSLSWESINPNTGRWYLNTDRIIPWTNQELVHIQIAVDIHERKLSEQALQDSEERFRSSFENTMVGMALVDQEGNFLAVNQAACTMLKYSKDQLLSKTFLDITHPDSQQESLSSFQKSLQNHKPYSVEKKYLTKKGDTIIGLTSISPVFNEKGEFLYAVAHLQDVTAQRKIELELRAQQDFYNQILSNVQDGIWVTNHNDRLIYLNPGMEAIAGVKAEKLLGLSVLEDFPPETIGEFSAFYKQAQETEEPVQYEASILTPAGRQSVQAGWLIPRFEGDVYQGMICSIQDVTEQRANARKLEESETKFRSLFENMLDGFALHEIVLDTQGKPTNYIFLDLNDSFEKMTGLEREKTIGRKVTKVIPGIDKDPAGWIQRYGQVALTGKETRFEQYSEPLKKWFSVLAFSPAPKQFATIVRDISNQKMIENALKESETRYRSLVETSPDGILTIDHSGKVLSVNQAFLDLSGYEANDFIGKPFTGIPTLAKQDLKLFKGIVGDIFTGKSIDRIEFKWKHASGEIRDGEAKVNLVKLKEQTILQAIVRDITEMKSTQMVLEESEQRYRELFQGMASLAVIYDQEARFRLINQAAAHNLGLTVEECLGKKLGEFIPANQEITVKRIQKILKQGQSQNFEDQIELPDGSQRWYSTVMQPVQLPGDPSQFVQSISIDITPQKEIEQQLFENEQLYRQLYQYSGMGVGYYTPDGKVISYNDIALNHMGLSLEQVVGKNITELFPPEQAEIYLDRMQQTLATDSKLEFEDLVELKRGPSWFLSIYSVVKDQTGAPLGVQIISLDITERKQIEESLRKSDFIINSTSDSVISTDLQGIITSWNPGAEDLYGYSAQEAPGQPVSILYREQDLPDLELTISELNSGGTPGTIEVTNLTKDGQELTVLLTLSTIQDKEGKVTELVGITKDITPLRLAQQSLQLEKQRTQLYLDVAEVMLLALDTQGRVQTINPKGCEMLGYPEEQILGKNWFDHFLVSEEVDQVQAVFQQAVSGQIHLVEYNENYIVQADGTQRLIAWHNSILPGEEEDEIIGVFSSGEDITDRRIAELELLKSKETAERYLNIAAEIILSLDTQGNITLLNASGHYLLGYQPGELIGKNWMETCLPEEERPRSQEILSSMLSENPEDYEVIQGRVLTKAGQIKTILWHNSQIQDERGEVSGTLSSGEDITEQTRIMEELAQSRQLLYNLSQAAQKIQYLLDQSEIFQTIGKEIAALGFNTSILALSEDGRELSLEYNWYSNPLLEKVDQLSEILAGNYSFEVKPNDFFNQILETDQYFVDSFDDNFLRFAMPWLTKPAEAVLRKILKMDSAIFAPLRSDDQVLGLITVFGQDLTEEDIPPIALFASQASTALRNARYAEDLHKRTEELESLTRLISETEEAERKRMAQELHDQVGQSLALLGFNLNQIKDQFEKSRDVNPEKIENAQEILNEVTSGIRSVMDDLRPAILDDYGLLSALHWYADKISEQTGLEITVKGENLLPRLEKETEITLFRITQEALTNVARHAQATAVNLELAEEQDQIRLIIEDDGVGFDLDRSRAGGKSSGWGLINMGERAARISGNLEVESEIDKGTRLIITVPRHR